MAQSSNPNTPEHSMMRLFMTGFGMGSADVVPGVSGGTIAFIFGIYEELIESIKLVSGSVVKKIVTGDILGGLKLVPWKFLLPLFGGIFTALISLAHILEQLLETQPVNVWSFFFGLVVASIWLVQKRVEAWNGIRILSLVLALVAAYLLVGLVPTQTPATPLLFFVSGAIAICAMILPGISGSFLLVMMGKYSQVLAAVNDRDVMTLGMVAGGALIGLALFSRLLSWLFTYHEQIVVAALTGLMIGSLRKIWPYKEVVSEEIVRNTLPFGSTSSMMVALLLALLGMGIILFLESKAQISEE